jgi:hypothetical protein
MTGDRSSRLFYHGTQDEVRLGDHVRIRRWLRRPLEGVVCYIPGLSPLHRELPREWAIQLPDGSLRVMVYSPDEAQPRRKFELIERDAAFEPLRPNVVLEEWSGGGSDD